MKNIDRLPPHNFEAEQAALGAVLLDSAYALGELIERFPAGSEPFYDGRHQSIFDAMVALSDQRAPVDIISLSEKLRSANQLEAVGGIPYLAALPDATTTEANISYYADIIEEKSLLRRLIRACTLAIASAYDEATDVEAVINEAEKGIMAVRRQTRRDTKKISELVPAAIASIERQWSLQGKTGGISTGLIDIDRITDGFHPTDVIVIAAYPSGGKSTLAMNLVEQIAVDQKIPVGMFSLEMSGERITARLLGSRARVNLRQLKNMSEQDFKRLTTAAAQINTAKVWINDSSDMTISQLRSKARRMVQQDGVKLIVIDYLQLLGSPGTKHQSREQEVAQISRGCKMMAQELSVPVIVLSQLNDDGKLRESRAIGQDADGIWILRPVLEEESKKRKIAMPNNLSDGVLTECLIAKNRDGESGVVVPLVFLKKFVRFENAETNKPTGE